MRKERLCRKCGSPKEGANLTSNGKCRKCTKSYYDSRYVANREHFIWKGNAAKQRLVRRNMEAVVDYLLVHPCVDCGEPDPLVLEFDHRDRATKKLEVTQLIQRVKIDKVLLEIAKCDVRCCNCHRRRTAKQLGHLRLRILEERAARSKAAA